MPRADRQQPTTPAANQPAAIPVSKAGKTLAKKTRANGKNTRGRQSDYNPKYVQMAEVLMREHGFTEAELAETLQCTVATLTKWKTENPELLLAINRGRDAFDSTKVRQALRSRALGYRYTETSTKTIQLKTKRTNADGKKETFVHPAEEVTVTDKALAPDVTACIFWLVNRQPDDWKHVARTIIQGDPKNPVAHKYEFDLSKLPEKELAQLESIVAKARADKASGSDASGRGPSGNA